MENNEDELNAYLNQVKTQAEECDRIGRSFANKMIQGMVDLDPEFSKTVDDNLWELI